MPACNRERRWVRSLCARSLPEVLVPLAQTLVLPDSRLLSYDDLGDPDGAPVIFFHGVPGSRRHWALAGPDDAASEKGVRLVSVDRPGLGRSSPAPHRTAADFAADIEHLADYLALERLGLMALSGGTVYALETAVRMPERVGGVSLISPVADLSVPTHLAGLDPLTRKGLNALIAHPSAWRIPDRVDSAKMLALAANRVWSLLPSADRRVLALPGVKRAAQSMFEETARHGLEGVRLELILMVAPWAFALADVPAPVDIHVGSADPWSTSEMVHWLRVGLRSPRVMTYDGGGHFTVLVQHADDVLESLLARCGLERPSALASKPA